VGLGSNLGEPLAHLARARAALAALRLARLDAVSSIYWTEPQGYKEQAWFANQVARLACKPELTPDDLLYELMEIERQLGREREDPSRSDGVRFGPRVIDLDLLLFGNLTKQTRVLTLPHPRMRTRAFVLVPLRELAPDLVFPDKKSLDAVLEKVSFCVESDKIWQSVPLTQSYEE
jgi:2-amino-4-hydroxy-6-hydroxymethyldihydropteridine diphosphokinase